jgi:drug/metabolite transporter (DMT)-like permease
MRNSLNLKGGAALLAGAITYACFGVFIRIMSTMFSIFAQTAFRFVVAFLILVAITLVTRKFEVLKGSTLVRAALLGVLFCAVVFTFTIAVTQTTIANTVFVLYAGSIVTSLLIGTFVFHEELTVGKVFAIALALIGLALYSSALLSLSLGLVMALVSGILDGFCNSLRKTFKGVNRSTALLHQYAFGALLALVILAIYPQGAITTVSIAPIVTGVLFGAALVGLGNLLLYGFQHFDVNVGTVILATELFFATIIGWAFYSEIPTGHEVLGGLIIFSASILSAVELPAWFRRRLV